MTRIHLHVTHTPSTFGDKKCLSCSLTVAEFVNGGLYTLSPGCSAYFHHQCWPVRGRHPPDIVSIISTMNSTKNYGR